MEKPLIYKRGTDYCSVTRTEKVYWRINLSVHCSVLLVKRIIYMPLGDTIGGN